MNISVIIPTLNEENFIEECIQKVKARASQTIEIIIVDAGSHDNTQEIVAKTQGCHLIIAPELKGKKYASLNRGAEAASGDVLVFLDADTVIPSGYDVLIEREIRNGSIGGAFELRFYPNSRTLSMIAFMNRLRYRTTHRFFGDQAVFCTQEAFRMSGGYPPRLVMEAAHFCDRMKKLGPLGLIKTPVFTSSRRFTENGTWKVFLNDLSIYTQDLLGVLKPGKGSAYWKQNAAR